MKRTQVIALLQSGFQLADARKRQNVDKRCHIYVKTTDNSGKDKLSAEKCRARYEVTLNNGALPATTLADLESFNFAKLSCHFKWRRLADDINPMQKWLYETWGRHYGMRADYKRPYFRAWGSFGSRKYRRCLVADEVKNTAAYEELRRLMTFTAIRPDFGASNAREVSLLSVSHASTLISDFRVVLSAL